MLTVVQSRLHPMYGDTWLDQYRRMFGVQGRLRVERMLASAVSFYGGRYEEGEHPFEVLRGAYEKLFGEVAHGEMPKETKEVGLRSGRKFIRKYVALDSDA